MSVMDWYYRFLAQKPCWMIAMMSAICSTGFIISVTMRALPDFSDPTLGFETRQTTIGKKLITWHNLQQNTGPGELLSINPLQLSYLKKLTKSLNIKDAYRLHKQRKNHSKVKKHKHKFQMKENLVSIQRSLNKTTKRQKKEQEIYKNVLRMKDPGIGEQSLIELLEASKSFEMNETLLKESIFQPLQTIPSIDEYFCNAPGKEYSHFVVEVKPNLLDLNSFLAICALQEQIIAVNNYKEHCQRSLIGTNDCCRPWSVANYAAFISNKNSCYDLETEDVLRLQQILSNCTDYYLNPDACFPATNCPGIQECQQHHELIHNVLHFLTDSHFISEINATNSNDLNSFSAGTKYTMIFVPVAQSTNILPLYHEWKNMGLSNALARVVAMDLGLESELFNELLLTDAWLVALGGLFVMVCMCLYTGSIFITLMTCIAVIFTLALAYFTYTLIFRMSFFPYMNLLAVVVIIGIGADDAFIFVKMWQCNSQRQSLFLNDNPSSNNIELKKCLRKSSSVDLKNENSSSLLSLESLMAMTVRHAALSMFVTSVTTAGAFFASYTSHITAIKCFGIFAGTAVICNYLLMISWLPASIAIRKHFSRRFSTSSNTKDQQKKSICSNCFSNNWLQLSVMVRKSWKQFYQKLGKIIVKLVMNYSSVWCTLFGICGIVGTLVVLYRPGLQLPENSHFPLFIASHPFELYDTKYKQEFRFEKVLTNYESFKLPLRFIWGVNPYDDGDATDPFNYGHLRFQKNFNITTPQAQEWLLYFCKEVKKQPFYQLGYGFMQPDCFLENFITLMDRKCIDSMDETIDHTPCCNISKFPFSTYVFERCLPEIMASLYATPRQYFLPGVGGPRFLTSSNKTEEYENSTKTTYSIAAIVLEFQTNISYSMIYRKMQQFVAMIDAWFDNVIKTAPLELKDGWFISELRFFDVQHNLSDGTLVSMLVAMIASLVVLFLATFNFWIAMFAVISVSLAIFVTLAILVGLGWKLNILESITVSTAIGLAVDFSLHYSIQYRLAPKTDPSEAARYAMVRIMGPTIMAALTTGIAGGIMMFSQVLPYRQIGVFLVIVMTVSWLYSTFFLMSLLQLCSGLFRTQTKCRKPTRKIAQRDISFNLKNNEAEDKDSQDEADIEESVNESSKTKRQSPL